MLHVTTPKPPTENKLLNRRCLAALMALAMPRKLGSLTARDRFARRCLWIRYLVRTGRLREPIS